MNNLQAQVEVLEKRRSNWLAINLVGFCIWDGLRILDNYFLNRDKDIILTGIILIGWLIWIISLIQILRLVKKMKFNKQIAQILNDELMELNRYKTWRFSFAMVLTTQLIIIIVTPYAGGITGILSAELSVFVSVVSVIGGFFYFNREPND